MADINMYKYGKLTEKLKNGDVIEIDKINAEPVKIEIINHRLNECKVTVGCRSLMINTMAESWMLENVADIKINGTSKLKELKV